MASASTDLALEDPQIPPSELEAFSNEFDLYLSFPDLTQQQVRNVEDTLLKLLTRLDGLSALLDTASSDQRKIREEIVPVLRKKTDELRKLFIFIERVRAMVSDSRKSLEALEKQIEVEEEKLTPTPVKQFFSLFGAGKKVEATDEIQMVDMTSFFQKLREDLGLPARPQ